MPEFGARAYRRPDESEGGKSRSSCSARLDQTVLPEDCRDRASGCGGPACCPGCDCEQRARERGGHEPRGCLDGRGRHDAGRDFAPDLSGSNGRRDRYGVYRRSGRPPVHCDSPTCNFGSMASGSLDMQINSAGWRQVPIIAVGMAGPPVDVAVMATDSVVAPINPICRRNPSIPGLCRIASPTCARPFELSLPWSVRLSSAARRCILRTLPCDSSLPP